MTSRCRPPLTELWRPCQIDALDPCALLMVIFAVVLGGFWLAFFIYRAPACLSSVLACASTA